MAGLKGKVAIIGGASKGLGKGCAVELAKAGVNIVLCARNPDVLERTAKEIENLGVSCLPLAVDMSKVSDNESIVNEALKRFGRIDILINNSGGPPAGNFKQFGDEDWLNAFHSVLMYAIRMTKLVLPHMQQNSWGRIINIASLSVKEPAETLVLSNVFRAGVLGFSKSIAKELIKSNITINTLCPGAFKTDRAAELIRKAAEDSGRTPAQVEEENKLKLPLGRYQTPEELGAFAAFLCSDIAGGITGTTIQVDGGISNSLL
jgi:3-oxoacyl-[acyl-carrier protein] reductase